jgi:hypothetical protein
MSAPFVTIAELGREQAAIRNRWPDEFDDGARYAFTQKAEGPREPGGYPIGFHGWLFERWNAWFAGYNLGLCDRARFECKGQA